MPEPESDPPRQFYGFKPREFERANPPAASSASDQAAGGSLHDPSRPIEVRELYAQASVPGPLLNAARPVQPNEVHAILRENSAREAAAGLHEVSLKETRQSHRLRDYLLLFVLGNAVLGSLALYTFRSGNVYSFVPIVGGIGAYNAVLIWFIWFLMDR
jgi:hypothetical protein